jgi:hypothetical protein
VLDTGGRPKKNLHCACSLARRPERRRATSPLLVSSTESQKEQDVESDDVRKCSKMFEIVGTKKLFRVTVSMF